MSDIKKIETLASLNTSNIIKGVVKRVENRKWLKYSQDIAITTLTIMDEKGISQKELANKMGVSPQYINKLLRGKEKLNLETISKLEVALDTSLIRITFNKK